MMMLRIVVGLAMVVGTLVVLVQGLDAFTIWNLVPVIGVLALTLLAQRSRRTSGRTRAILAGAGLVALTVVAVTHLAWHYDWGKTATGSSTSGLIFLMIPIWSVGAGVGVAGLAVLAGMLFRGNEGAA